MKGLINLDFADIKTVMSNQGMAIMGAGHASGDHRATEAATNAISSPLLENISIDGATGIIINVTGPPNLSLHEVNEASILVTDMAHEDAEIIFGAVIDESLTDELKSDSHCGLALMNTTVLKSIREILEIENHLSPIAHLQK